MVPLLWPHHGRDFDFSGYPGECGVRFLTVSMVFFGIHGPICFGGRIFGSVYPSFSFGALSPAVCSMGSRSSYCVFGTFTVNQWVFFYCQLDDHSLYSMGLLGI